MMRNTGRWLLFLLCVLLCACGTLVDVDFGAFSMADGGGADSGSCKTCQTLGAQCGIQDDGCGNALDCGDSCPNGGTCNGMTCVCPAKSCMTLGVECGPSDDGCGNSIDCGVCAAGLSCVSNHCKCVALTCSDYMNPQCAAPTRRAAAPTPSTAAPRARSASRTATTACARPPRARRRRARRSRPSATPSRMAAAERSVRARRAPRRRRAAAQAWPTRCGCTAKTCAEWA